MTPVPCSCPGGHAAFPVKGAPLFRFFCHCTICQRFNDAPYADMLVYRAEDVDLPPPGAVEFVTLKPPPNVRRGKCAHCGAPTIETFHVPLLPKLTMVPRAVHPNDAALPQSSAHVFYETRIDDADDALPKHEGFVRSQWAFLRYYLRGKGAA